MKQNFTCESDSPLIDYKGGWTAHVGNVPESMNSSSTVWMASETNGDVVYFNFTGTAVWVYPASNTPHGNYDVFLDGTLSRVDQSHGPTDLDTPLFQSTGLQSIPHVLSIHNTGTNGTANAPGTAHLDVAYITWEERDRYGNATSVVVNGEEDTSGSMSWFPFDMWSTQTLNVVQGSTNGQGTTNVTISVHVANASDAYMQYNFSANTVSIYGNVGPNQSAYSVAMGYVLADGRSIGSMDTEDVFDLPDEQFLNASFPFNRTKVLLFHAANINASRTTSLKLTNHPNKQNDTIAIDYIVLSSYATDGSATVVQSSFPVPAMVGTIIGALIILGLVIIAFFFLRKRRQGKLIRQQKTNVFKDLLVRRGVLAAPPTDDKKFDVDGHGGHQRIQSTDSTTKN